MHVFFVNTRYVPEGIGGPAFSVKFLAEQLVREGDRATVFCRSDRPGVSHEILEGVDVIRVGGELDEKDVVDELRRALIRFKPDVVHTNFLRDIPIEAVTAEIRAHQLRRIHTLRVADPEQARRALASELSAVVGVSQFVLDFHDGLGLCRHARVKRVIHNSYDPPEGIASFRTPSAKGEPLRLGYLGRLDPSKGVEYLMDVLTKEMREDAWTLTVAGAGTPNFERRLKREFVDPRIRMLGLSRPVDLFKQVDVLVVPSLWKEALARVAIEAYAHGVPVVASNRGGLPELVEPGVTGLIFDPDKSGALAAALRSLIRDRMNLAAMRDPARAKWERQFTAAAILREYREVYIQALAWT